MGGVTLPAGSGGEKERSICPIRALKNYRSLHFSADNPAVMATSTLQLLRSELEDRFFLDGIELTDASGKTLGEGSYGKAVKVYITELTSYILHHY